MLPGSVRFYSLPDLVHRRSPDPASVRQVAEGVKQFAWSPAQDAAGARQYVLVTRADRVMVHSAGGFALMRPQAGGCATWHPDGSFLALGRDDQLVLQSVADPAVSFATVLSHPEADMDSCALAVDSVHWVEGHAVVVSCCGVNEEQEGDDAYGLVATWSALPAAAGEEPADFTLSALNLAFVEALATPRLSGPHLNCTGGLGRTHGDAA